MSTARQQRVVHTWFAQLANEDAFARFTFISRFDFVEHNYGILLVLFIAVFIGMEQPGQTPVRVDDLFGSRLQTQAANLTHAAQNRTNLLVDGEETVVVVFDTDLSIEEVLVVTHCRVEEVEERECDAMFSIFLRM